MFALSGFYQSMKRRLTVTEGYERLKVGNKIIRQDSKLMSSFVRLVGPDVRVALPLLGQTRSSMSEGGSDESSNLLNGNATRLIGRTLIVKQDIDKSILLKQQESIRGEETDGFRQS